MMRHTDQAALERRVKMRRFLTVVAVVAVLAGVAYGVYSVTLGRQVLKGQTTLDFGVIEFDDHSEPQTGQFELVNSLDQPLVIPKVSSSCGCTVVDTGPWTVEPGETWVLPVSFSINTLGPKTAKLTVVLEGHGVQVLHVRGIGRTTRLLSSPYANGFTLRPGLPSIVAVHAATYEEGAPPALEVTDAPGNVTVTFSGWEKSSVQQIGEHQPTRWTTQLEVRQEGGDPVDNGSLTVTASGTDHSITIPINASIPGSIVDSPAVGQPQAPTETPQGSEPDDH